MLQSISAYDAFNVSGLIITHITGIGTIAWWIMVWRENAARDKRE